jgi:hypothetical protein
MFYKSQKVFDYQYGCGEVIEAKDNKVLVRFEDTEQEVWYTDKGVILNGTLTMKPTLSTTEYGFIGFSQEEVIDYDAYIGYWGKFYEDDEVKMIGILNDCEQIDNNTYYLYPFFDQPSIYYKNFVPLTDEEISYLGLEQ